MGVRDGELCSDGLFLPFAQTLGRFPGPRVPTGTGAFGGLFDALGQLR